MLETILFQILTPFIVNPGDPEGKTNYRAGYGEIKNSYTTDKPPTEYPMLTLDLLAYDNEFNTVKPGIYAVNLTPDSRQLLFMQAGKIVAKSPVFQFIQLEDELKVAVPSAKVAFIKDDKIIIIYKFDNLEAHGVLYKTKAYPN